MKLYFEETVHRDPARIGYDDVFITYSLLPFGKSEAGHTQNRVWYFVEIDDGYTPAEAASLAGRAIQMARTQKIGVSAAIHHLTTKRKRKRT